MTIDPTYAVQALAWAAVWAAGGLAVRSWLSGREPQQRDEHGTGPGVR